MALDSLIGDGGLIGGLLDEIEISSAVLGSDDLLGDALSGDLIGHVSGTVQGVLGGNLIGNLLGGDLLGGDLLGGVLGGDLLGGLPGSDLVDGALGDVTGLLGAVTEVLGDLGDNGVETALSAVTAILGEVVQGVVSVVNFAGPLTDEAGNIVADLVDGAVEALAFVIAPALGGLSGLTDGQLADLESLAADLLGDGTVLLPAIDALGTADALIFVNSNSDAGDIDGLVGVSLLPGLDLPLGDLYETLSDIDETLGLDAQVNLTLENGTGLDVTVDLFDTL